MPAPLLALHASLPFPHHSPSPVVAPSRLGAYNWGKLAVVVTSWAWLVATFLVLAWLTSIWLSAPPSLNHQMDAGAFLGAAASWPHLYSSQPATFLSPPLVAIVALPFLHIPLNIEPLIWRLALALALVVAWKLIELKRSPRLWLLVLLGNPITFFTLTQGQITPFVLLGLALAVWLWRRGRLLEAGLALALAAQMKPTLFIALPLALLAANQARLLLGLVLGTFALALLYTLLLSPAWLIDFLSATISDHHNLINAQSNTVASFGALAWVIRILILLLVPLVAYRSRPEVALIGALIASLVLTPYLHQEDLLVVFIIAWLFAAIHSPSLSVVVCAAGLVAAALFSPLLLLTWEFVTLLLVSKIARPFSLVPLSRRLLIARIPFSP